LFTRLRLFTNLQTDHAAVFFMIVIASIMPVARAGKRVCGAVGALVAIRRQIGDEKIY
jgi:hypothetical protein